MNMKTVFDRILCLFFPRRCAYCGEVIEPQYTVCESCTKSLPEILPPVCPLCGHSKADCRCKQHKHKFEAVVAPFYYTGCVVKAIHRLKYENKDFVAETLGKDMANCFRKQYADISFDLVTFVPFSAHEKRRRAFNQSELLAREVAKQTGIPLRDILVKLYDVPKQHDTAGAERKGNVLGIYDVVETADLSDKTVLLIDDIKTTGSTLDECAKMLLLRGAEQVYALTAAVAQKRAEEK